LGSVSPDLSAQWHQPNNVSRPSPMSPPGQWTPWKEGEKQPFAPSAGQVKSSKKGPTYDPLRKIDCTKCEVLVVFSHRIWVLGVKVNRYSLWKLDRWFSLGWEPAQWEPERVSKNNQCQFSIRL
jgi:hypothetical protein